MFNEKKTININQLNIILSNYFHKKEINIDEIAYGSNYRDYKVLKPSIGGVLDITFSFVKEDKIIYKRKKERIQRKDKGMIKQRTINSIKSADHYVLEKKEDRDSFWCIKKYNDKKVGFKYWRTQTVSLVDNKVIITNSNSGYMEKEFLAPKEADDFYQNLKPNSMITFITAMHLIQNSQKKKIQGE